MEFHDAKDNKGNQGNPVMDQDEDEDEDEDEDTMVKKPPE